MQPPCPLAAAALLLLLPGSLGLAMQPQTWSRSWYPLSFAKVTDRERVSSLELLGAPIALWHDGSAFRASVDRCPHRLAALSEGRVTEDGDVQCPYHGWSFDGSGACTAIPQMDDAAKGARVCSSSAARLTMLPVVDRAGILWAWSAPLFDDAAEPDLMALEALTMEATLNEPGVLYTDYSRDLPMDATVLLENVLDPSHLPFTHHKTISSRDKASSVPITIAAPPTAAGFHGDRFTSAPGTVDFAAPITVVAKTDRGPDSYRDWDIVYCAPQRPGKCRLFVRVVFEVAKVPPPLNVVFNVVFRMPPWFTHVSNHNVLEDDNIFLHKQGISLHDGGAQVSADWAKRVFLPTSADAAVSAYRTWLAEFTDGQGALWSKYLPPEAHAQQFLPVSRAVLLDRERSHLDHCTSCQGALKAADTTAAAAEVAMLGGLLLAGLFGANEVGLAGAASAVAAFGARTAAVTARAKLTDGEYPPKRNE